MIYEYLSEEEKKQFDDAKTLYHYCSCESFKNIIESKEIWLSQYSFMNDSKETKFFDELLMRCFAKEEIDKKLSEIYNSKIEQSSLNSYYLCLSYADDLLSNWRAYGDDGKGFAIGFDKDCLKRECAQLFSFSETKIRLDPVKYIESSDLNFVQKIYDSCKETIKNEQDSFDKNYTLIPLIINELIEIRNFIKDSSFAEEKECRFAFIINNISNCNLKTHHNLLSVLKELSYKARSDAIIPYYPLKLNNNYVSSIVVGPKNVSRLEDINSFITKSNLGDIIVKKSKISYR